MSDRVRTPSRGWLGTSEDAAATRSGTASLAIAAIVDGPVRVGRVLGAWPRAVYVGLDDGAVVAVVSSDGIRLPNAVVAPVAAGRLPPVQAGAPARVGQSAVSAGAWCVRASRRWDPVPRLPATTPAMLSGRLDQLAALVTPGGLEAAAAETAERFAAAAARLDVATATAAADRLVGAGPGLTPAGDDLLAGFLAGARLLEDTLPGGKARRCAELGAAVADVVVPVAPERTPALSAALLGHASRAEMAAPAAKVLRTLVGGGDLAGAAARLCSVGHTSGRDLAQGLLVAGRAALTAVGAAAGRDPR